MSDLAPLVMSGALTLVLVVLYATYSGSDELVVAMLSVVVVVAIVAFLTLFIFYMPAPEGAPPYGTSELPEVPYEMRD